MSYVHVLIYMKNHTVTKHSGYFSYYYPSAVRAVTPHNALGEALPSVLESGHMTDSWKTLDKSLKVSGP